jgi:hypothetical protein
MDVIYQLTIYYMSLLHTVVAEDEMEQNVKPLFNGANVDHLRKGSTLQAYMKA